MSRNLAADACILAIDQGTTNTKALLVDPEGRVVAEGSAALGVSYPQPGWVEQDPLAVWESVLSAVGKCLAAAGGARVGAVAVTNQRESVTAWDRRAGQPLGPVVVWQCRRTTEACAALKARGVEAFIHQRTGLQLDPLFSATKFRWLLEQIPSGPQRAAEGAICLGTMDAWVLWNLTGGAVHACDASNASRTMLLDLASASWDAGLLDIFGVPAAALPAVRSSSEVYGETVACGPLPGGLPVAALIGDSHAALYGHAGFLPGAIKATYGTGTSLMTPIAAPRLSARGLSTTVAWQRDRTTYALEGNISATGAAVQWLADLVGGGVEAVEALARTVPDAGGAYVVPAFVGLGAPHWDATARGLITGLTRGTTPAHLARATLEAIAYQVRDVFDAMQQEAGTPLTLLLADGGATRNDLLMQFQADILGVPVLRTSAASGGLDVSALGAAYLAGLATGVWRSEDEIAALPRATERFEPRLDAGRREALYAGWTRAVARARFDPDRDAERSIT